MIPSPLIIQLQKHASQIGPVVPVDLSSNAVCQLDFTSANSSFYGKDLRDTSSFTHLVDDLLATQKATVGVGGYLENRTIYGRSNHFNAQEERRSIHLGVDIWTEAFTPVTAPLNGRVHSFQDNANFGDYGPTIILEHQLENQTFYTLYGHLTRTSLTSLFVGKQVNKGENFSHIGPFPENGDWPPHLHFQLMTDMLGFAGDFPGVCTVAQKDYYAQICLNPNLILQSSYLN